MLSTQLSFFLWLALAILFSIGVLTSAEIRRGFQRDPRARPSARTGWMLGVLVGSAACGILVLTAGLFLILPRTARAAASLMPNHRFSGFTNLGNLLNFGLVIEGRQVRRSCISVLMARHCRLVSNGAELR